MRHPKDMGAFEVTAYLSYLTNEQGVSASTHQQALSALLFLYKEVLAQDYLPAVLTVSESKFSKPWKNKKAALIGRPFRFICNRRD